MLTKLAVPALLAATFFLGPTAHAKECYGPLIDVPFGGPGVRWGEESSCSCGSIRGGALVSSETYGMVWSQGKGVVTLELEYYVRTGETRRITNVVAVRATGEPFSAPNGNGYEGAVRVDNVFSDMTWSGRYQAICDDFS